MIDIAALPFLIVSLAPWTPQTGEQITLRLGYCCEQPGYATRYSPKRCVRSSFGTAAERRYIAHVEVKARAANDPVAIAAAVEHLLGEARRRCGRPS